jgi:hypothetical protein
MTPNKPTVVLSQPAASKPMAGALVVEAVETEPGGKLQVSGQARPGVALRLYLNDSLPPFQYSSDCPKAFEDGQPGADVADLRNFLSQLCNSAAASLRPRVEAFGEAAVATRRIVSC